MSLPRTVTSGRVAKPPLWLTRDSFEGTLEDFVDVWEMRPWRSYHRGDELESLGVTWFDDSLTGTAFRSERLTVSAARIRFGNSLPEDDRQCVKVG